MEMGSKRENFHPTNKQNIGRKSQYSEGFGGLERKSGREDEEEKHKIVKKSPFKD